MPANPLLSGIRVLDLTRLLPGPFCTLYLAQLGAEVIKVEDPPGPDGTGGDYARRMYPDLFRQVNRGKRSVTLNLRVRSDVQVFHEMVKDADVVIESFRPGVMDGLGCGYGILKTLNARLVYAALTGYGQSGPRRDLAGHDVNYLSYAGILDQIGVAGGPPALANVQIADLAGGALTTAIGILAAVIGARASGCGTFVDVSMLEGSLALQVASLARLNATGKVAERGSDMLTGALANYRIYRCADGRHMAVGALEAKFLKVLVDEIKKGVPASTGALLDDAVADGPRSGQAAQDGDRLGEALAQAFALHSRDDWAERLANTDACCSPVLTLEEALASAQVTERGMLDTAGGARAFRLPIRFDAPRQAVGASPTLGADNEAILSAYRARVS